MNQAQRLSFIIFALFICLLAAPLWVNAQENTALLCSDGIDNDGDGLIDCDDTECDTLPNDGCLTCLEDGLSFADIVIEYSPTCLDVLVFKKPHLALGVSDNSGNIGQENFVGLGDGGYIKLGFVNNLVINSGTPAGDVWVFEIGNAVEASFVELQPFDDFTRNALIGEGIQDIDADGYYEFGKIEGATSSVDIDAFATGFAMGELRFNAIKIIDSIDLGCGVAPGAEIDAVCALSSVVAEICGNGIDDDADGFFDCDDPDLENDCCCQPVSNVELGPDIHICPLDSTILSVDTGFVSYLWQDGSTLNTITAFDEGNYALTVTDANGCKFSDTIVLTYNTDAFIFRDFSICGGEELEIDGNIFSTSGTYFDTLVDLSNTCDTIVEYNITVGSIIQDMLGSDQIICSNSTELISPFNNTTWPDGSVSRTFNIDQSGVYVARAMDDANCPQTDTIIVQLFNIGDVYLPTAFSPNNDGINEKFQPNFPGTFPMFYGLTVFNSWGAKVFEAEQYEAAWDGTTNGKRAPTGLYVWLLKVQNENCEAAEYLYGNVSLLR